MPKYSERIALTNPSLSEALRDRSLPSIDMLKIDFHDSLKGRPYGTRIDSALSLAEKLRGGYKLGLEDESTLIYPSQDVISAIFLDAVILQGHDTYFKENRSRKGRPNPERFEKLMNTRATFKDDIFDYARIFDGAPDSTMYEGLRAIMYEAECILRNKDELPKGLEVKSRRLLTGMLGEHKVLHGLRSSGWGYAYYASNRLEDYFKSDIIVPFGELRDRTSLAIQVKTNSDADAILTVSQMPDSNDLLVVVPTHKSRLQLSLPEDERQLLAQTITGYSQPKLRNSA